MDLKRKLGNPGLLTPSKISKLSSSFDTLGFKAHSKQETSEKPETQDATASDSIMCLPSQQELVTVPAVPKC